MRKSRRLPSDRSSKRQAPKKAAKPFFYIFCEGQNTEPKYLKDFASAHSNSLVKAKGGFGVPLSVVTKAIQQKKENLKANQNNSAVKKDIYVAIVDVDNHPNFPATKALAKAQKIDLIISNPCVEIWALWHLQDHTRNTHRHALQSLLKENMPTYDHKKKAVFNYDLMHNYGAAKSRAQRMSTYHKKGGTRFPQDNPSSNMHELLDRIILAGKKTS